MLTTVAFCSDTSSNARSSLLSGRMAFHSALAETAIDRLNAGVPMWRCWGPGGGVMYPVGDLPPAAPPVLRQLTIDEWRAHAKDRGMVSEVQALQEPLYYFLLHKELLRLGHQWQLLCSKKRCGGLAQVMGVHVKHYPLRQDLCTCCATNAAKRGLLPAAWTAGLPRRLWGPHLAAQNSIMPAA